MVLSAFCDAWMHHSLHGLSRCCGVAGNYDTFVKTVKENEVIQQKQYEKEQNDIKHIKEFIASCG